jgi:hypothetical protein
MNYFKRLETTFIIIIILVLAIAYGLLSKKSYAPVNPPQPVQEQRQGEGQEKVELVPAGTVSYQGVDGKNAMELLKASHDVQTQSFGDMGEFVKAIDGIEPDSMHFWSFYINGSQAQVGADTYMTKSTDLIEWKLEEIK